jgi:hypothetical protein
MSEKKAKINKEYPIYNHKLIITIKFNNLVIQSEKSKLQFKI